MSVCKNMLVYSEDRELVLQLLGKGRELADKGGGELYTLLLGSDITGADELIGYGADMVYVVDDPKLAQFGLEPYRAAVLEAVGKASSGFVLIGATKRGKELAARVAAALDTGCMTECVGLDIDGEGKLRAERLTYGGSTISTQVSNREPHVATVPARAFEKLEPSSKSGEVIRLDVDLPDARVKILETREKSKGDLGLENAPVIVSAGRGFKEQGDLRLLEELAKAVMETGEICFVNSMRLSSISWKTSIPPYSIVTETPRISLSLAWPLKTLKNMVRKASSGI